MRKMHAVYLLLVIASLTLALAGGAWAVEYLPDKEGVAEIKMIHNGVWVLIAKREEAYPDAAECDKQAWAASLTFEIH